MITGLSLMIAAAGLLLVGMLMARLRAVDQTLQLKRHRSNEPAVCDLLNYAAGVGNGIVIGKNGALIAAWEYVGDDTRASRISSGTWCPCGSTRRCRGWGTGGCC